MKYYISSFKFGKEINLLRQMIPNNNRIGHVNNARDYIGRDPLSASRHQQEEIAFLNSIGFKAEILDLQDYFEKKEKLKHLMDQLGGVWLSGGNTFVLRQAMKLSGFDEIILEMDDGRDFLYSGYSAGVCILSDTLEFYDQVDEPYNFPYSGIKQPIWEGLGILNYSILPHYNSEHIESEDIAKEVQRCIISKRLFKAIRDGEVLIIE